MNRMEQVHVQRHLADARRWSAAWKAAAKSRKRFNTTAVEPLIEALSKDAEVKAELAEMTTDRDSWKRRAQYLEARAQGEPTVVLRHQYTRQETS